MVMVVPQGNVKQVEGSEPLFSGRLNPPINPLNLNRSLIELDASHDVTCNVDFWHLTVESWSNGCVEHMNKAYDGPQNTGL